MVFNSAMLFLLLLVASASGGQAERSYLKGEDPSSSFRVLDRINTILEKELNMLDGGSQVSECGSHKQLAAAIHAARPGGGG